MRRRTHADFAAMVIAGAVPFLTACQQPERQSPDFGAPGELRAREERVNEYPYDAGARIELEQTKQVIAHRLAEEAQQALDAGLTHEALRLASMAASYDESHRPLEYRAREAVVEELLTDAGEAAEVNAWSRARSNLQEALRVLPQHPDASRLLASLDDAEARSLIEQAEEAAAAGDDERAFALLSRANAIQPDDPEIADTLERLTHENRQRRFDRLLEAARDAIGEGRLSQAGPYLQTLEAFSIESDELESLREEYDRRRAISRGLIEQAREAFAADRFDAAIGNLLAALEVDRDPQIETLLRDMRLERGRRALMAALEEGDRLGALLAARELASLEKSDRAAASMVARLEREYVVHTIAEAKRLREAGDREQAREMLERALVSVEAPSNRRLLEGALNDD